MTDLLELQKYFILQHLRPGDTAVDFTMGNGHDTAFLSRTVGENGKVYAFDIQPFALESTEKTLKESGCPDNTVLILDSHHNASNYVKEKIRAGMFNLGYMPGSGNKSLTTKRETTIPAVKDAIGMLGKDAILLVAVYPGHEEGRLEGEEIREMLSSLSKYTYTVGFFRLINSPDAPYFMIVETK